MSLSPRHLSLLLEPSKPMSRPMAVRWVVLLLAGSAACLVGASMLMPAPYRWLANAISESAAQGQRGAWLARLGFLQFGVAVLWLVALRRVSWARATTWMLTAFALFMVGTAAFSHRPWLPGIAFDPVEDALHTLTATGMGFAFSFGVAARLMQPRPQDAWGRAGDAVALIAASALPPTGMLWPHYAGLLQRVLFAVAYAWFIREALAARPRGAHPVGARSG